MLLDHRDGLPVLADFGTAKRMRPAGPSTSGSGGALGGTTRTWIGTPGYMAPELCRAESTSEGYTVAV